MRSWRIIDKGIHEASRFPFSSVSLGVFGVGVTTESAFGPLAGLRDCFPFPIAPLSLGLKRMSW